MKNWLPPGVLPNATGANLPRKFLKLMVSSVPMDLSRFLNCWISFIILRASSSNSFKKNRITVNTSNVAGDGAGHSTGELGGGGSNAGGTTAAIAGTVAVLPRAMRALGYRRLELWSEAATDYRKLTEVAASPGSR